jgi:hypothetical protein
MTADALFAFIEKLQAPSPWGAVLDAGTGKHSLEWIAGLPTDRWTAVTVDARTAASLAESLGPRLRPADRIVTGNWSDPLLLHGEVHDVVVADYLLGAVEGFAPYFQDRLFTRLRPHVGRRLYVIGLEPLPERSDHPWGQVVLDVSRLVGACIQLAGHRAYREFPCDWTVRGLGEAGFVVEEVRVFPICYGARFVNEHLDTCLRKLPHLGDRRLAEELRRSIEALRRRALDLHELHRGTPFGEDYVICARPA